jgi:hypothetical protein
MEIRTGTLTFGRGRGEGPRTELAIFNFTSPVRQAVAILTGVSFGFSPRDDHHLGLVNTRLSTAIDDDVVTVEGALGVRDWSGEFDDDYEGNIQFLVLAELEPAALPSNLSITGVEYNQAIQFFRSQLDPATARADNFIGLIAGKSTVLRVYVDTQNDPARPTIAEISGRLEIRISGTAAFQTINPLNGPIAPKRDAAIRRTNADDTLNFLIPGPFSSGQLEYRVRVFDSAHPDEPGFTSGRLQDTLTFTDVTPLRVRGVGVHYTGMGLDIAAPTLADLRSTLSFVQKTYPVGQVFISGIDVIDYDGDFTDMSGDGCGDGWDGLLDILRDMQGDSDDIYYGLVPSAVPRGWGGCGGGDGKVAAGPVGRGATAAQEIAHAFDRDHAPCGGAGDTDPNYPVYDALPSASIGEFGIDDSGAVQDPSTTSDFMSYCSPKWVSTYTYESLQQNFRPISRRAFRATFNQTDEERPTTPTEILFLSFSIYRGGRVEVNPSFHYPSLFPAARPGRLTPYAVELRDCHDRVLQAQRVLLNDPHKNLDSAKLHFLKSIPFHPDTARIVFTCGGESECQQKVLSVVDVPAQAPRVIITYPKSGVELSGKVTVTWHAQFQDKMLTYLLRYSNDGGSSFRTISPKLKATEYVVDLDRLPGGEVCLFQVLATEGIRIGTATSSPFSVSNRDVEVVVISPKPGTVFEPGQIVSLSGEAFAPHTGSLADSQLRWRSDVDDDLGRGHEVQVKTLRPGVHNISLNVPDVYGAKVVASTRIEIRAKIDGKHTSLTHPDHSSKDHDSGHIPYKPEGGSRYGD